jgi:hypothetical protein
LATDGIDGKVVAYSERLWPSIGMWFFAIVMTASLGIAYGRAYGNALGLLVGLATMAAVLIGLAVNAPVIRIDELNFRAGRARLPLEFVGQVKVLDVEQSKRARSTDAHAGAHFQLRGGIGESLIIEVTDPQDPHPYWQVSSRQPGKLLVALERAKTTAGN